MFRSKSFGEYLDLHVVYAENLLKLRKICLDSGLEETMKWGMPTYCYEGKNVIGLGAFKNFLAIWFFQGVFLSDKKGVLRNAQKGKTKGMRSWQFEKGGKIDVRGVKGYVRESIENHKKGLKVSPSRKKTVSLPKEMKNAFKKDLKLESAFKEFTPGKQREFADHIAEAKREATRIRRLNKCIPMILSGVGLNDKYR
ncbi:MAG: hypothetical protein HKN16_02815 [Saprospiraceae bacterium]|nr:hypothetical protein [Saprospiraceae bacterium]